MKTCHGESPGLLKLLLGTLLAGLLAACGGGGGSASEDAERSAAGDGSRRDLTASTLEITSARWDSDDREVRVEGRAGRDVRVTVADADSGASIGRDRAEDDGRWRVKEDDLRTAPCRVRASAEGYASVERAVDNAPSSCAPVAGGGGDDGGTGGGGGAGNGGTTPPPVQGDLTVLAANDLGMHCADQDYQIFSILPPFNVLHAQVIQRGTNGSEPRILSNAEIDLVYSAVSNPLDPAGANSINTTSINLVGGFKSNFWEASGQGTLGGETYGRLYPSQDKLGLCDASQGPCPSALALFEPLPDDTGLPVPDPAHLPALVTGQQSMPGPANIPQHFDRFDTDLPFFANFPFGSVIANANWFAADGIPILPVDDSNRPNAYPLMRVTAINPASDATNSANHRASVDVVLPVAAEADCQGCHADPDDAGNGAATIFAATDTYADGVTTWVIETQATAPGPQPLLNAAKINILRLHDAKHGADYTSSVDASPRPCMNGTEPSCLANSTPIQCAQCHYTPALDLAQAGPVDEPEAGERGRQQTRHITMSRAMHGHHGSLPEFNGAPLFPDMPPPVDANGNPRDPFVAGAVLEQTCYQCHPGKQTQCLRGAMFSAGVVCQDCHGGMQQVGDDFSASFASIAFPDGADLSKRIPWASEPACQSCHTGDAMNNLSGAGLVKASDGIRLLQAWRSGDRTATPILASNKRFAENENLYRLSTGHGGVKCQGCHGSTHAIWPNQNPVANDNVAAKQLQGHAGTISDCSVCHEAGSLGLTLEGPHGMHPVNDRNWNLNHEDVAERNANACRACHGRNGEGTPLSRVAVDRSFLRDDEGGRTVNFVKGEAVRCDSCHENEL